MFNWVLSFSLSDKIAKTIFETISHYAFQELQVVNKTSGARQKIHPLLWEGW